MNMGTLFAFIAVAAVLFLRITQLHADRPFKCPAAIFVMLLSIFGCAFLMCNLSPHMDSFWGVVLVGVR